MKMVSMKWESEMVHHRLWSAYGLARGIWSEAACNWARNIHLCLTLSSLPIQYLFCRILLDLKVCVSSVLKTNPVSFIWLAESCRSAKIPLLSPRQIVDKKSFFAVGRIALWIIKHNGNPISGLLSQASSQECCVYFAFPKVPHAWAHLPETYFSISVYHVGVKVWLY